MFKTEAEILDGCLRNDPRAQACLYDKYKARLMAVCRRYTRTNFEAEDVFQEAFLKIFEQISTLKEAASLAGWMKRITVNTAINHFRKYEKLLAITDIDTALEQASDDHLTCLAQLEANELLAVIQQLPEGCQMVFNLHVIDDYTHAEIAKQLNISESTSKTQYMRAKALLKKKLLTLGFNIENEVKIEV